MQKQVFQAQNAIGSTTLEEGLKFIQEVGYPVIVKPDNGVGASDTHKLHNQEEVERFYRSKPGIQYVMEEFINGNIYSYDAITNQNGDPLFETMTAWPPSIMDIVNDEKDLAYYVGNEIPEVLRDMGRTYGKKHSMQEIGLYIWSFSV